MCGQPFSLAGTGEMEYREMDDWLSSQRYETMEKTLSREAPQMDISAAKELLSGEKRISLSV